MRIAIVSTMLGSDWGGSEELWAELAAEALAAGHEVRLFLPRPRAGTPRRVADLLTRGARVFHRTAPFDGRLHRLPKAFALYARVTRPFKALYRFRPDAVFFSLGDTASALHVADAGLPHRLACLGVPYVAVSQLHDDGGTPAVAARARLLEFLRGAYRAGFVSDRNRVSVRRQLADPLPNAIVVRNPVNLADKSYVPWSAGEPTFACAARLTTCHKGQDLLFEALSSDVWRDRPWRLRLYGEGPDAQYLHDLAAYFRLSDRIEFRGHVRDIRTVWAENQMLLVPSRSEGTPLALVEAMLCGRPAVATDVGGNVEWIEEGRTGFIADAPSTRSIGAALDRAWSASSTWQEMGRRAHEVAARQVDPQPGRTMLDLLQQAVASVGRAADPTAAVRVNVPGTTTP